MTAVSLSLVKGSQSNRQRCLAPLPNPLSGATLRLILLRLPLKQLFTCKTVCKEWNLVISEPDFPTEYRRCPSRQPHPRYSGYFSIVPHHQAEGAVVKFYADGDITSRDRVTGKYLVSALRPDGDGDGASAHTPPGPPTNIVASSCGVLLYGRQEREVGWVFNVFNPLTKKSRCIPALLTPSPTCIVGFMCREGTPSSSYAYQIHYIAAPSRYSHVLHSLFTTVHTYSSWSGHWWMETITLTSSLAVNCNKFGVVTGRVLHWRGRKSNCLYVYYPDRHLIEEVVPPAALLQAEFTTAQDSTGSVLCYCSDWQGLQVWVYRTASKNWVWRHKVTWYEWVELPKEIPFLVAMKEICRGDRRPPIVAASPGDPDKVFLYMGIVVSYQLSTWKLELLVGPENYRKCMPPHNIPYHMPSWPLQL